MEGMESFQGMIQDAQAANNAFNAQQVQKQMDFQKETNRIAMDFNSAEASKNRAWQKMMSDTAHQREMSDLIASGLNPILAVQGGQGAPVGSGATASGAHGSSGNAARAGDQNIAALTSALNGLLQRKTQMEMADMSAKTNLAVAERYTAMSKYVAELQSATGISLENIRGAFSKDIAGINAEANKYSANAMAGAQMYAADQHKAATEITAAANKWIAQQNNLSAERRTQMSNDVARYSADVQAAATRYSADQSAANKRELQEAQQKFDDYIHKTFPSNVWQASGGLSGLFNGQGMFGGLLPPIGPGLSGLPGFGSGGKF